MAIKYIGSKRRLVTDIGDLYDASGSETASDVFTGTTRVAQELKIRGAYVHAIDTARYSELFAQCHIEIDAATVNFAELEGILSYLNGLPGKAGYVTEVFCNESRYFQPFNGERIDQIRDTIDVEFKTHPYYPILITSLIYAADKVDSTVGVQMAYLKSWAPRSYNPLLLTVPDLYEGAGKAWRGDACKLATEIPTVDFAYLDPPYNQHSYFANYHIWETLVAWDKPDTYGIAKKRVDVRETENKSVFNRKREMPIALDALIRDTRANTLVLSYNDESWITLPELKTICATRGEVVSYQYDSKRYVGATIGIHNPAGQKVGTPGKKRNIEYLIVSGKDLSWLK